jgi:hypothetical protein
MTSKHALNIRQPIKDKTKISKPPMEKIKNKPKD